VMAGVSLVDTLNWQMDYGAVIGVRCCREN
jgi:hypothetical protein